MNLLKKIFAIVLVAAMSLSFCGCHKKNEIAIKVGDVEFTSAYYMCALIEADMAARQEIDSKAESDDSIDTSAEGYYYSQKIDGKKFVTYVKDKAIESIKELAAYKSKAKSVNLEISKEEQSTIDLYVDYYWSSYGYQSVYEPNGVSKETFATYFADSYYSGSYFDYLYGSEGTKAIDEKEITDFQNENYCLVEKLSVDLSSLEDAEKLTKTEQFNLYFDQLKKDASKFNEIYESYNSLDDSSKQESYATVVRSDKTDNADSDFETIKAMAVGEVKLIKPEDGSSITIVIKKDLSTDTTNIESIDSEIRHLLKDDEFDEDIAEYQKTLKFTEIKSATKQFDVKKIVYPETSSAS